ncbi:hypothetical protein MMC10_008554 [Thelotrema lepadinum]|nr:hypothetical protein [Thelotrema lepadinum]
MDNNSEEPKCAKCSKPQSQLAEQLKRCAECQTTRYCSRDCQRADWKAHKKCCGIEFDPEGWQIQKMPARVAPGNAHLDLSVPVGGNAKDLLKLHGENDTYKLLIQSYRCMDEDDRVAAGRLDIDKANIRPQYITGHSFNGLKEFIAKAERNGNLLPTWWNAQKREQCEKVAREMYHWSDIETTVPKEIDDW